MPISEQDIQYRYYDGPEGGEIGAGGAESHVVTLMGQPTDSNGATPLALSVEGSSGELPSGKLMILDYQFVASSSMGTACSAYICLARGKATNIVARLTACFDADPAENFTADLNFDKAMFPWVRLLPFQANQVVYDEVGEIYKIQNSGFFYVIFNPVTTGGHTYGANFRCSAMVRFAMVE